jgi:hypothetical protein
VFGMLWVRIVAAAPLTRGKPKKPELTAWKMAWLDSIVILVASLVVVLCAAFTN